MNLNKEKAQASRWMRFIGFPAILIYFTIILIGCKKFVEIDPPNNQLVTEVVFSNDATAITALTSIYSQMYSINNFPYNISLATGLQGDELTSYSTSLNVVQLYQNGLNSIDGVSPNFWQSGYNLIYQANAVMEGCQRSTGLSAQVKRQLIAEAKFIRAFWYFYLVNLYGDIPLNLTTDYNVNSVARRIPTVQVYDGIIKDLLDAEAEISVNYVSANSISNANDRVRPNKAVVLALLSRVYLYAGKYQDSEATASKVIDNPAYILEPIDKVFLKSGMEAIWQIATPTPAAVTNTLEGANYILSGKPSTGVGLNTTISRRLYDSFEAGDLRKSNWVSAFTDQSVIPAISYRYPYKYKQVGTTGAVLEYTIPFRLAEQYLIRAEAKTQLGNFLAAQNDLNKIRNRANLGNTTAGDKSSLLTAILHERQTELFCEYGHRWFDLKRMSLTTAIMPTISEEKGGIWSPFKVLWPIPSQEILNNPSMRQNQGYN